MSLFGGGLALAGALAHALHRDPREHDGLDLVVLGAATFKASRPIARDERGRRRQRRERLDTGWVRRV